MPSQFSSQHSVDGTGRWRELGIAFKVVPSPVCSL
jgi:hypothetical protein